MLLRRVLLPMQVRAVQCSAVQWCNPVYACCQYTAKPSCHLAIMHARWFTAEHNEHGCIADDAAMLYDCIRHPYVANTKRTCRPYAHVTSLSLSQTCKCTAEPLIDTSRVDTPAAMSAASMGGGSQAWPLSTIR